MRSLKLVAGSAAVVAVCAVAAGCTSDAGGSPSASPSPSASGAATGEPQQVRLRFSVYGGAADLDAYQRLADAYTAQHPEVSIALETAPDAATAMDNLDTEAVRGTAPDVFLADRSALPALVAEQRVQPVDELLDERGVRFGDGYQRVGLEGFSADSALQCMPHDVSPLVVFYNTSLVHPRRMHVAGEDAPSTDDGWTWDQFAMAARRAGAPGVNGVYVEPALRDLAPLVWSAGAEVTDDRRLPTTLTLSDENTRAALEQVLALLRTPGVAPTREDLARQGAVSRFTHDKLAMMFGTRALVPRLRQSGVDFDVFPLPNLGKAQSLATMSGYCLSPHSANLGPAADFLAFAVGDEGAKITATAGDIVPANLAAAHASEYLQPGQLPRHPSVFTDQVRRSFAEPFTAAWPQVVAETEPLLEQLFYARTPDLDTILPTMDAASARILAPEPSTSPSP